MNGYTVTGQPASGKVTVAGDSYTYTPTQAARLQAALTTPLDYDSFPAVISGQPATTVTVPVLPAVLSNESSMPIGSTTALTNPTGLAVHGSGSYAYVANQGINTVSVINTATGAVAKTLVVGSQPSAVAVSPTTNRAYVTNRASGTVSVINTANNTVVGTAIRVGSLPQDVAVNATGTRVYVANSGSNTVSVINTATNQVIATIGVGQAPTAVAVHGSRAYVVNRTSGTVSAIDTGTNSVFATVSAGLSPQDVAVSLSGNRIYVANTGSSTVSVIDTANGATTTIGVGSEPTSLAVSPDGSLVVVARRNDYVAVIDTKSNTVIGATQHLLDTTTGDGGHIVAFGPDGRAFVTDAFDRTVRVVGMKPADITAPTVVVTAPAGNVSGTVS